jgi:hypothetical protein
MRAVPLLAGKYPAKILMVVVFPGTIRSKEPQDFPWLNAKGDILNGWGRAVDFAEMLDFNHGYWGVITTLMREAADIKNTRLTPA